MERELAHEPSHHVHRTLQRRVQRTGVLAAGFGHIGRPPPEPPTFFATSAMILPACTRVVRSLVTPTISATFPSCTDPSTTTPEPSLLRMLSTRVRIWLRSRLSTRWASTLIPLASSTCSAADETT